VNVHLYAGTNCFNRKVFGREPFKEASDEDDSDEASGDESDAPLTDLQRLKAFYKQQDATPYPSHWQVDPTLSNSPPAQYATRLKSPSTSTTAFASSPEPVIPSLEPVILDEDDMSDSEDGMFDGHHTRVLVLLTTIIQTQTPI
jgi:hypothetical protein